MPGPHEPTPAPAAVRGTVDPQETRRLTQLRISVDPATVVYGRSTVVGARPVDDLTGATIGGQSLALWVRTRGSVTFEHLGSGVTDSVGLVRWRRRYPATSADYEVRYAGTATLVPSVSRRIPVTVIPAPSTLRVSAAPTNPTAGSTVTIGARLVRTDTARSSPASR